MYVGGIFSTIGGQSRNRIAAVDASTGLATSWDPSASNRVSALAVSGATVYAGGSFQIMAAVARSRLAAIDLTTGVVTAWSPVASHAVEAMAIYGPTVYLGGDFVTLGGQPRNKIGAVDAATSGRGRPVRHHVPSKAILLTPPSRLGFHGAAFPIPAGPHEIAFDAHDLPAGVYLCLLRVIPRSTWRRIVSTR